MDAQTKENAYKLALSQVESVLKGETDQILKMATVNCILRENLPYYFWTGFYIAHGEELLVGPYQGTLGCLHIPFGKGVCGTAAKERKTQLVKDVHQFAGHIACDSRSQSEIVVPVLNKSGELIAVFDVDSSEVGSFDEIDQRYLEELLKDLF
ncbi:MAG: GAF domain-containing protein [Patescibacteria group bacterium]